MLALVREFTKGTMSDGIRTAAYLAPSDGRANCATMCYMTESARAGVRELRQNASKLLERVEAGETIEITNHGRVVARLVPVDMAYPRPFAVLVSEGLIHGADGRPWEIEPLDAPPGTPSNADLLAEQRADR